MEEERIGLDATKFQPFIQIVRKAQHGDKGSMDEIIDYFTEDIEYLSRFIMQPREDTIQTLRTELINIVCQI